MTAADREEFMGGLIGACLVSERLRFHLGAALFSVLTFSSQFLQAAPQIPYYGQDFYLGLQSGVRDAELVERLQMVFVGKHLVRDGELDLIVGKCEFGARDCYWHKPVGYKTARRIILGELDLRPLSTAGEYGIAEVYCDRLFTQDDFPYGPPPSPGVSPSRDVLTIEHTWPQSLFNVSIDIETQKSDLHHLFPTEKDMNTVRGNNPFGDVDLPHGELVCPASKFGSVRGQTADFFEPPAGHKGNVARAMFYFSVRYQLKIGRAQEEFLRKWHIEDPVDETERARNERIHKIQGNRNPFIDFPELVGSITDF